MSWSKSSVCALIHDGSLLSPRRWRKIYVVWVENIVEAALSSALDGHFPAVSQPNCTKLVTWTSFKSFSLQRHDMKGRAAPPTLGRLGCRFPHPPALSSTWAMSTHVFQQFNVFSMGSMYTLMTYFNEAWRRINTLDLRCFDVFCCYSCKLLPYSAPGTLILMNFWLTSSSSWFGCLPCIINILAYVQVVCGAGNRATRRRNWIWRQRYGGC